MIHEVVITGCVAQVDVERLKKLTGADLIIANSHKTQMPEILKKHIQGGLAEKVFHSNIFKKEDLDEGGGIESSRTRAFLKIQDGCNSFCSFCIIPFARGKSRSLSVNHLVERVEKLHQEGFQEVVLTGVHCGDYEDGDQKFSDLVEQVLLKTKIPRVRLSSLEPIEIDEKLWKLFSTEPRLCQHLHMSIQSANSNVLKNMKRKYGQEEIKKFFSHFDKNMPHGFVGMDVIVGFPGETDEEFDDTLDFLSLQPISKIHVFPYSIRPGTLAAKREDQLPSNVIHERAHQLRRLSRLKNEEQARRQLGRTKRVLILEKPAYGAQGLSQDYWPVHFDGASLEEYINQEVEVQITGLSESKSGDFMLNAIILKA
jgi:threonylcarbamoyladenosine tRNA methylthiotransferase MtaB